ncbi:Phosphoesterase RecJ domain-containing protein [Candidatus Electronema halotolerans]
MKRTRIRQAIEQAQNIVLATHVRPDGDALGATLGLADILSMTGRQVLCYFEEPLGTLGQFLVKDMLRRKTDLRKAAAFRVHDLLRIETDIGQVAAFVQECGQNIMGICLDCGDLSRLGKNGEALRKIRPFAVIDHHQSNDGFGDLHWIEPHRSSTGEMVYDLAADMGLAESVSPAAAKCLYTALVTDTGSFQYDAVSSHTFAVAARLMERGAKPAEISEQLYAQATFGSLQLLQLVLATLQTFRDDQVAMMQVSQKMLQTTGTTYEDCDSLINFPRSVGTVRVAVLLKEKENREISVSLRAKGDCDVAKVAAQFGGGGHRNAAGFRLHDLSLEQMQAVLMPVLEEALQAAGGAG